MATSLLPLLMLFLVTKSSCTQVPTSIQTVVNDCKIKYLVAVTEEADGIGVSLLYENVATDSKSTSVALSKTYARLAIDGHDFSTECGDTFFRCQDLFVESTSLNATLTKHFVFLPLSDGLQIIEILDDGRSLHFGDHYLLDTSLPATYRCSPVASFSILHDHYLVCVDSVRHYISLSTIYRNTTSLRHSALSNPILEFNVHASEDMKTLSNFIYVEPDHGTELIYFAVGNNMFSMSPVFYTINDDLGRIGLNCTRVKKLEYVGNNQLIAYCDYVYVHYNLVFDDWELQSWNDIDGVTFSCPNSNVHLNVFKGARFISYEMESRVGNINIPGEKFDNGVCFGEADKTFFAFSDLNEGVFVVDLSTSNITQISSVPCDPTGCLPLLLPQGKYLLVRESHQGDGNVFLMDTHKNLSKIIFAKHIVPKLITLINITDRECELNSSIDIISFDTSNVIGAILGGVMGAIFFIVLISVMVVVVVKGVMPFYRRCPTPPRPIQVETEEHNSDSETTTPRDETKEGKSKSFMLAVSSRLDDLDRTESAGTHCENESLMSQTNPSKSTVHNHDLNASQLSSGAMLNDNTPLAIDMDSNIPLTAVTMGSGGGGAPLAIDMGSMTNDVLSEIPKLDTVLSPEDEEKWKSEEDTVSSGSSVSITYTDTSPLIH